jgi:peptidoglycan/xylan/chitin deacetylase (PgdA/CDA1 family)
MFRCLLTSIALFATCVVSLAQAPAEGGPSISVVLPKVTYSSIHADGPYIALTFDDGPSAKNTPRLLDMLAKRNVKATFFVIGRCVAEYPNLVKRTVQEGHEIANHSWSHPDLARRSEEAVRSELQKTHTAILQASGEAPVLFRPPYGSFTERQRRWVNQEFGYKTIMWDVDPLDWKRPGASVVAERIFAATRPGSIVLAHDIHEQTIDAMPRVIDGLLAKGYKFVTVSELLAMDNPPKPTPAPNLKKTPATTQKASTGNTRLAAGNAPERRAGDSL